MERIKKIITMLENGQHKEALNEYNVVLQSGMPEEKFLLGEELFQYGFLDEARALVENLLNSYPEEGELLILLGEILIEAGEEEEAILVLERVSELDVHYAQSLLLMADLYQLQGLYEVCENKLLKAKEILPNEIIIDFALGELYSEQGEVTAALNAYEKVLKETTEVASVNIHARMADLLSASGVFEEALVYYDKALEEKLEINTLFGYAFTALQAGYNRTAIEKFTELKELDPEYHSLYLLLGKAYEREEELENSFRIVQEGIKLDEFNKDLFFYGGQIAAKLGKLPEAEQYLREALVLDPGFTQAVVVLNKLFLQEERYEDVLLLLSDLGLTDDEEPQLLWDSALAYQKLESYSKALDKYESAYTFFKNNETFLQDYGYFLMEEGKTTPAAEIFKQLLAFDPTNSEYLDVLERLDQFED
ncbi:tetratricopeptide repeat protein [Neobacillus rhizophilus]|uniref:Tetratricopeptide repeat protein n=1 Tax=Neobacillus rhizophilus TaxID=2833579 RepID=A0A942YZ88_9BACI|nr:tetratricopeptide repeat protein [Neobacillus rhizophilus]MBS4215866.1 tetratricopeptide repeat protein [Neobacillus rhizophilus]MBU8916237.1 tetratricopeptide repeat protein [Bacillus sp. FJAT-29953]